MALDAVDALVLEGLERIARTGAAVDRVAKALLRAHPELDGRGRRRLAHGLHGVRCLEARLDHLLRGVGLEPSVPLRWACYRADVLGEVDVEPRALARLGAVPWPANAVERLAAARSLPPWLARAWIERFGETGADALAEASNRPGPITVRARRTIISSGALAERLHREGQPTRPGRLVSGALHLVDRRPDIRGCAAWREGAFEVQDEGSQLVVEAVGARPGETVLDLCAGSGGKTLALADAMEERGRVVAADVDAARLADLRGRARRLELTCVEVVSLGSASGEGALPTGFDRVLVDAPCTSLGTLRRGPDRRWRVDEVSPARMAALQLELLERGARLLRPGGRLVYATCTLGTDENEGVAARFSERNPGLGRAAVLPGRGSLAEGEAPELCLRPDVHGTDGFFIAAWQRAP